VSITNPFFQEQPSEWHEESFKEFHATELYCPNCKRPVPVKCRLLLVLPQGEKYEYLCSFCLASVGSKIVRNAKPFQIIKG
jgi:hypothetical protein